MLKPRHLLYLSNLSAKTDDLLLPEVGIEGPRDIIPNIDRYPETFGIRNVTAHRMTMDDGLNDDGLSKQKNGIPE